MAKRTDISGHSFKWMMYLIDIVIHISIFTFLVYFVVEKAGWRNYDSDSRFFYDRFGHLYVLIVSYIAAVLTTRIRTKDLESNLETIFRAAFQVGFTYVYFAISVGILYHTFPGHLLMWSSLSALVLVPLSHYLITSKIVKDRKKPANVINTVFVGADDNAVQLFRQFSGGVSINGYNVLGFFTTTHRDSIPEGASLLGKISDVPGYIRTGGVDEVYCALSPSASKADIDPIIKACDDTFTTFYFVPNMDGYPQRRMHSTRYKDVTVLNLHKEPLSDPYKRAAKRTFDIAVSGLFLVTLYPLVWIVVATITKLTSPGPVLFRQQRTGYNGKAFTCLKFRSMKVNADADKVQATADDPRKTRFGDFLRRTSIDELPQFINVFRGDMSIVGPRPHMELHTEMYSNLISEYLVRHLCRPGITGWAQVSGCRGETRTVGEMEDRVKHDIWYIENWSMLLDLRIIAKTVIQVLGHDKQAY